MANIEKTENTKKYWLVGLGVAALASLSLVLILLFAGKGATTVNTFVVAQGYCYQNRERLPGTYSPNECAAVEGWEKWCSFNGRKCKYNNNEVPPNGLCARTLARSTTYSAISSEAQCAGAQDNKYYANCEYAPGVVPPWKCSSGVNPPPVPSRAYNPNDESKLGLCALTNNANTTYQPEPTSFTKCHSLSGGRFKIDFYPDCQPWPGPLPWQCS